MNLFKNGVGRPSNDTLKKRRIMIAAIIFVVVVAILGLGYYFLARPDVVGSDKNASTSKGDVNGDGKITMVDVQMALSASANLTTLSNDQKSRADMNSSGNVSASDARKIMKKITVKLGDINKDGKVNTSDAEYAMRIAAGLTSASTGKIDRGDMDGDGKVTSADARIILKKAVSSAILADVNRDGKVDSSDVNLVMKAAARTATLNNIQNILADVNGDGKVTSADARVISRYVNSSAYPTYELGDVNMDKKVDQEDAKLALKAASRTTTLNDNQTLLADMDGNGSVSSSDARTILRLAASRLN